VGAEDAGVATTALSNAMYSRFAPQKKESKGRKKQGKEIIGKAKEQEGRAAGGAYS